MLQKILLCLYFIIYINSPLAKTFEKVLINDQYVKEINKYEVQIPVSLYKFGCGFSPAIGAGLAFYGINKHNNLQFFSASNSGPNFCGPKTAKNENIQIFPAPEFSPYFGLIELSINDRAVLSNLTNFKDSSNKNLTGLIPENSISYKKNINVASNLLPLNTDLSGINPGAISSIDKKGNLWIAEGYRPAILKIDPKTGIIMEEVSPNNLLPSILLKNQIGKGFESLTLSPEGKIFTSMSSTLDIDQKTKNKALFIRIIEFDPNTQKTKTYAYPYNFGEYNKNQNVIISDIEHISDYKFLLVEQGRNTDSQMNNYIYMIDLQNTTDISDITLASGLDLEFATLEELNKLNIVMAKKTLLFNMQDYGWKNDILNGLTLVNSKTLAIIDDNNFNFRFTVGLNNQDIDMESVFTDYKTGNLIYNNKPLDSKIEITKSDNIPNNIWMIELTKPLN